MIGKDAIKALAIALFLLLGFAAPALALDANHLDDRFYDGDYNLGLARDFDRDHEHAGFLSSSEIAESLTSKGYTRVIDVKYSMRKRRYFATGTDSFGSTYRLSVNAYSGRVIGRRHLRGPELSDYETFYFDRFN